MSKHLVTIALNESDARRILQALSLAHDEILRTTNELGENETNVVAQLTDIEKRIQGVIEAARLRSRADGIEAALRQGVDHAD